MRWHCVNAEQLRRWGGRASGTFLWVRSQWMQPERCLPRVLRPKPEVDPNVATCDAAGGRVDCVMPVAWHVECVALLHSAMQPVGARILGEALQVGSSHIDQAVIVRDAPAQLALVLHALIHQLRHLVVIQQLALIWSEESEVLGARDHHHHVLRRVGVKRGEGASRAHP
eukprot:CAMPEP_0174701256 /NCGR_PEP_ID=MMETSP1094-20130205/5955_1 /TAXON_ID=156173 /ORGANISM="Chrysochromulina brevifilum, Strain UTEX LB 985" /LENGTH=169 /DNA_ID=CAMNT_0015898871 /DNA_START=250 /DNA_END=759 /DNA_ORIENTATION=+